MEQVPALPIRPAPSQRGSTKLKPDTNVPAPWSSVELGRTLTPPQPAAAAAAAASESPEDESRGTPQAKSSGAQSSGSAAANPDTIEVDGVHVSTPGVSRIQTEEAVE